MKSLIVLVLTVLTGLTLVECQCDTEKVNRCLSRYLDLSLGESGIPTNKRDLELLCRKTEEDLECVREFENSCSDPQKRELVDVFNRLVLGLRSSVCDSRVELDSYLRVAKCVAPSKNLLKEKVLSSLLNTLKLRGSSLRDSVLQACCLYSGLLDEVLDVLRSSGNCDDESLVLVLRSLELLSDNVYRDVCTPNRVLDVRSSLLVSDVSSDLSLLKSNTCQNHLRSVRVLGEDDLSSVLDELRSHLKSSLRGSPKLRLNDLQRYLLVSNLRRVVVDDEVDSAAVLYLSVLRSLRESSLLL